MNNHPDPHAGFPYTAPPPATPEPVGAGEARTYVSPADLDHVLGGRSISSSEGWALVSRAELTRLRIADEALTTSTEATALREQQQREKLRGLLMPVGDPATDAWAFYADTKNKIIHEAAASLGINLNEV